jgi:radical SAM superfamily enzyme YgiQ (UPF0313 family)
MHELRTLARGVDLNIGIVYAFDFRTHILPYWYADKRMAPGSVRMLGDLLHSIGLRNVRIVLQQWNPNFRPSHARLNGRPLDLLLVSAMQVHAEGAYAVIRDAHQLGSDRPLILAGGPKAIYEPTDYFELGPQPGVGADCVSVGEAYVFLELLRALLTEKGRNETMRAAFERLRQRRALDEIPGLVYLPRDFNPEKPYAIHTGVQQLIRDLDELPMPEAGYRLLEPPHRGTGLSPEPVSAKRVGRLTPIASVISTHGCKFNCSYCPIPAVNQRTWRHKSPQRLAEEIRYIREQFGIKEIFSTDDNFFNHRETVEELMTGLAAMQSRGRPLGKQIRFSTEATQFDVYRNRDLLPLCKEGGLGAIWFGIEDITAELINKGQDSGTARELFAIMCKLGIAPMAMLMHNDNQPLVSPKGDLAGVINQARYLFDIGAVSYQCTYLGPAIGTRDIEAAAAARVLFRRVAGEPVAQAYFDGNHVVASKHADPASRQLNVLKGYNSFYNLRNTLRILYGGRYDGTFTRRLLFQLVGQIGVAITAPRMKAWADKLRQGPIEVYDGIIPARIPLVDAVAGHEIFWSVEQIPAPYLPQNADHRPSNTSTTRKLTQTVRVVEPVTPLHFKGDKLPLAS